MVEIREGRIHECIEISKAIPEFDNNYQKEEYERRIYGKYYLILIAELNKVPIGFKIGYAKENYFYSWLGGVLPIYRNKGIAKKLAMTQEKQVLKKEYFEVRFKTYNKYKPMLQFGLKNGFEIFDFEKEKGAIWLRKHIR